MNYYLENSCYFKLDDQVFSRYSGESRNPEGFVGLLDSGSPRRYARNDEVCYELN
jgi:hypothetical protein